MLLTSNKSCSSNGKLFKKLRIYFLAFLKKYKTISTTSTKTKYFSDKDASFFIKRRLKIDSKRSETKNECPKEIREKSAHTY